MLELAPGLIILAFMIGGGLWQRSREKQEWNNGVCSASGEPWLLFDHDSHGGRGYKDDAGNWLWVSYNVDNMEGKI